MAKGDVTLRFDAQTAAAVQNILNAQNALDAASIKVREFGDAAHKSGDKAHAAFDKIGEGATDMLVKLTGISSMMSIVDKGLEGITKAAEEYWEIQAEKASKFIEKTNQVNNALAASRQGGASGEVREGLEGIHRAGGMVVNPEERNQLFASISRAAPYATPEDKIAATRTALLGRAGQMDMDAATRLGSTFATLSRERRPGGAFEGATDEKLQDLAYAHPEGIEGRNLTFFNRAKDKQQALQMIGAASRSGEAAKALISIQSAEEEEYDPGKILKLTREIKHAGKRATEDQRRELRIAQLHPEERMGAMLSDETLVAPQQRAAVRDLRAQMANVPTGVSFSKTVQQEQGREDEATRLARQKQNNDAIAAEAAERNAVEATRAQNEFEQKKMFMRAGLPTGFKWLAGFEARVALDVDMNPEHYHPVKQAPRNNPVHDTLKDIHETLQEQNSTLRTRRDTTLSNNSEGQK